MACTAPCFDCPYLRLTDKLHLSDEDSFDHVFQHFTEDGGFQSVECEEQGDTCFGQIQMIANSLHTGLDPFSDIGEAVEQTKPNTKEYFKGPWEWKAFHDA